MSYPDLSSYAEDPQTPAPDLSGYAPDTTDTSAPAFADAGGTAPGPLDDFNSSAIDAYVNGDFNGDSGKPWGGSADGTGDTQASGEPPSAADSVGQTVDETQGAYGANAAPGQPVGDHGRVSPSAEGVGSWDAPSWGGGGSATIGSAPAQEGGGLWGRVKDFAGGVKDLATDAAKSAVLPERAMYDSFMNGNTPWDDPGAFIKDVYGSGWGQANADLDYLDAAYRAGSNIGGRIQGSAAIAGNDLVQGNWGRLPSDLNPASNAYYAITGEQPSYMPDEQYAARQVVAQNPFGAVIPGTAGEGTGPILPDWVPFVGDRSVYNLPGDTGLARGFAAVGGGFGAWGQGPSIDLEALRQDLANGMSVEEARAKYGGSTGTRTVSELLNPGDNIGVPGVPKAVGEALMARNMWEQLHKPEAQKSTPTIPNPGNWDRKS